MMIKRRYNADVDGAGGGSGDPAASDGNANQGNDIKNLESKFDKFVDVMSDAMSQPAAQPINQQTQNNDLIAPILTDDDLEEADFSDKQLGVVKKIVTGALNENNKKNKIETTKQVLDDKAYKEFPELANPKSTFYKVTSNIIAERNAVDPTAKERPDQIWSAALEANHLIQAQIQAQTTASSQNNQQIDTTRQRSVSSSHLEGSRGTTRLSQNNKNEQVSETRQWVKSKLGTA